MACLAFQILVGELKGIERIWELKVTPNWDENKLVGSFKNTQNELIDAFKIIQKEPRQFFVRREMWWEERILYYFLDSFNMEFDFYKGEKNNNMGVFKDTLFF